MRQSMKNLYHLKSVEYFYGDNSNSDRVLSNINVEIEPSKIVAIVGPNGSGKTTLLNLLAFLDLPKAGELCFKEKVINKQEIDSYKKQVGYVQQSPYLLRGSAYKNIELGLKLRHVDKESRHKKAEETIELLGITDLAKRSARSLSGGEAQKVAIGQVLALDPEILVLDEPFNHLDQDAILELEKLVVKLNKDFDKTIIFTTHNQIQAQSLADNVYSVIAGRLFEAHLVNLYSGSLDRKNNVFNTANLSIRVSDAIKQGEQIAIDPNQIVISNEKLDSSMQNSFLGKVTGMNEGEGNIKLNINIGEQIQATITHNALEQLKLSIGNDVWVSFKSSSIVVF